MCVVVSSRGMFELRDSCFSYDDTFTIPGSDN